MKETCRHPIILDPVKGDPALISLTTYAKKTLVNPVSGDDVPPVVPLEEAIIIMLTKEFDG